MPLRVSGGSVGLPDAVPGEKCSGVGIARRFLLYLCRCGCVMRACRRAGFRETERHIFKQGDLMMRGVYYEDDKLVFS